MNETAQCLTEWQSVVLRVARELAVLPESERLWIGQRLTVVRRLQRALQEEFLAAGGAPHCAVCSDSCCDRGRHHFTLVNLLAWLESGEVPPTPDFDQDCPWLGANGCILPAERRPFNCITFICTVVEDRFDENRRHRFYALERELRTIYEEFDRRYAGSSLCGLQQRAARLGATPFFARPAAAIGG